MLTSFLIWLEKSNITEYYEEKTNVECIVQITIRIFPALFEIHRIISEKILKYTQTPQQFQDSLSCLGRLSTVRNTYSLLMLIATITEYFINFFLTDI